MENNENTRAVLINAISGELQELMVHRKGAEVSKLFYMFASGVELETKGGVIVKELPIGPFFGYMVNLFEGKSAPQKFPDPFVKLRFTGENLDQLCEFAETNIFAKQAAEELSAYFLKENGSIPKELIPISISVLQNGKAQKKSKGPHPYQDIHRNASIAMLMQGIEKEGFTPIMRNDESINDNTNSLCDLMQKSCLNVGISIGFSRIKSIWNERESLLKYTPPFRISLEENDEGKTVCYIGYANPYKK